MASKTDTHKVVLVRNGATHSTHTDVTGAENAAKAANSAAKDLGLKDASYEVAEI